MSLSWPISQRLNDGEVCRLSRGTHHSFGAGGYSSTKKQPWLMPPSAPSGDKLGVWIMSAIIH